MAKTKTKRQNGMMERANFQASENYPSQETGLPQDRFQGEVQTATANQTKTTGADFIPNGEGKPEATSIVARTATVVKKKMSVKPTSDTILDDSKIVGGVPLGESGAQMSVAGAPASLVVGDQSRVPYSRGGARPTDRYGKKISTDNFVINNVISEQIEASFEEPKDLRESPDSVQGYNGRKQFKSARNKKTYGDHPTSTLFERSLDFIGHSAVVHCTGQVIGDVDPRSNYPTVTSTEGADYDVHVEKGNYLIKGLYLTIDGDKITNISIDETRIKTPDAMEAAEQANMNWQVDANNVAKAMVRMQTELGRETTDKWSPLGYVIKQPYEFGMLFHDGEAICGSLTGAAYKSAAHSLAFLQNKMAKEGVRNIASIAEWMGEDLVNASNGDLYNRFGNSEIFGTEFKRAGAASALIAMFDSTAKYTTKADFINQPRSLKFHLQAVDNNINPMHAKREFYKALDTAMLFSTDDGQYNPVLPIHVTDSVKIMTPYSLNAWLTHWTNPKYNVKPANCGEHGSFFRETGILDGVSYAYNDIRNEYTWEYVDPFIAGLCRWILRHESSIVKAYTDKDHAIATPIYLPLNITNTCANTLSFMICSAAQDITWMRNIIFRDYLFAGEQGVYVWEDLASLSELNPLYSSQYTYSDYGSALKLGALSNVNKIRLAWPEVIAPREDNNAKESALPGSVAAVLSPTRSYFLPFYFNENSIDPEAVSGIKADNGAIMSYPIIRNGVNHEQVDVLYSMSERDVRLTLDRMVSLPVLTTIQDDVVEGYYDTTGYVFNALRYDTNSDGRVIMTVKDADTIDAYALQEYTYLATPRELGFIFPLPVCIGKGVVEAESMTIDYDGVINAVVVPETAYVCGAKPTYMTCYRAVGDTSYTSIDRSASLSQHWIRCFASPLYHDANIEFVNVTDIIPALNCLFDVEYTGDAKDGKGVVKANYTLTNPQAYVIPAVYGLRSKSLVNVDNLENGFNVPVSANSTFSIAKAIWTIVQRYYAPINEFDAAFLKKENCLGHEYYDGLICDPLEFASYFGFAGTLGSDFNQDVLERLDKKDQLGMFYFEDEFIKSSLIFR